MTKKLHFLNGENIQNKNGIDTLTIKATPLPSGVVKSKTGNETDSTVYADWYKAVYMPTLTGVNTDEE